MKSNLKKMFAVTIALSVLSLGFSASSAVSAGTQSKEDVKLAAALKGCVILEDGESGLIYHYKCERCGHVQPGSVIMARRIPKGFRLQKHFRCVKCGAQNTAVIQG